ncbi:hypothetical protein [Flavobacterium sp. J27]|uniref:hypothetical protein n=1 Tax=Flavobacterium sp. J27 TaxID=2060419 RepID=UPI00103098DD|nr:hypothetical protein [Flavobacterium sp. J27]
MSLFRNLKNGNQYNALLPQSACERVNLGKGDTSFSVEMIVKQALQHREQVTELAEKLVAETNGSLEQVCNNIHSFLYWHLQYKADGEAQLLRSPACAWQQRYVGIDCKSYSIFASAILLQLGVKHYIRRIKQPTHNPEHYSHVYVIVPVNQKTGKLDKGYYTIDGTLPYTIEPIYTFKDDYYMDKLQHYGLNGSDINLSNLNFDSIKNLFSTPISCWNGTSFDGARAQEVANNIGKWHEMLLTNINNAVQSGNYSAISDLENKFKGKLEAGLCGYQKKITEGYNACTRESITKMIEILNFYKKVVWTGYDAWITTYFDFEIVGEKKYSNWAVEDLPVGMWFAYTGEPCFAKVPLRKFAIKAGVTAIPQFEFTPYLESAVQNPSSFDPLQFIQGLSTILVSFTGNNSTGTSGNGQVYDNNNPNVPVEPKTTKAGFSLIPSLLLFSGGVYAWSQMKDKDSKEKQPANSKTSKTK